MGAAYQPSPYFIIYIIAPESCNPSPSISPISLISPIKKQSLFVTVLETCCFFCGKKGIRTLEALLTLTRFPGGPLQPLEHLSVG